MDVIPRSAGNKLFRKMLVLFLFIVVLPAFLIGIASAFLFLNILVDQASASFSVSMDNMESTLEQMLFETKLAAHYMFLDLDLKEALDSYGIDPEQCAKAETFVRNKFSNYKISDTFSNVNAVKVYGFNNYNLSLGDNYVLNNLDDQRILNSPWYRKALREPERFIWTGLENYFVREGSEETISLFRVIQDRSYTKNTAMLYVNLDAKIFASLAERLGLGESSDIYILDSRNRTVNSLQTPEVLLEMVRSNEEAYSRNYGVVLNGEEHQQVFIRYLPEYNWKIVGVLQVNDVTSTTLRTVSFLALALVAFLFLASLLWFFVLSRVISPVKELTLATEKVREGDFSVQVHHPGSDELGELTDSFNYMVHKINDLLQEVVDETARKKDAEYRALQAQINPHFLYNTLNSIRWMAIIQKADNIKNVVDVLGRLLRNSTSKVNPFITVGEELGNLEDYVYIQKIAYNNKFTVEYDVDESLNSMGCLKFILQPLVENAIFHGILPKESYGIIKVTVKSEGGLLFLKVSDDGVGMAAGHKDESFNPLTNIGLGGLRERLNAAYGEAGRMDIHSEAGKGTSISLFIPLNEEPEPQGGEGRC